MPPSASSPDLPEALTREYQLGAQLGSGAFARVHQARQPALARDVVVKLVAADAGVPGAVRRRVEQEGRILAELRHPRVVRLLDYGVSERHVWLIYPDEGARSLDKVRKQGAARDPAWVLRLLGQVLEGLEYLHGQGILHRDLKPGNVLVLPSGDAQLVDFGLAKDLQEAGSLTGTDELLGTPLYMAPQQIEEGHAPDPRDDLYAAGLLAYELLAGRHPFAAADPAEVLRRHLGPRPPRLERVAPGVPRRAARLVDRLIARRREDRPRDARTARRALARGLRARASSPLARQRTRLQTEHDVPASKPDPGRTHRPAPLPDPDSPGAGPRAQAARRRRPGRPPWAPVPVFLLALGVGAFGVLRARPTGGAGPTRVDAADPGGLQAAAHATRARLAGLALDDARLDPIRRGPLHEELEAVRRLRDWLLEGGRPEALPAATLDALSSLDPVTHRRGLGMPLYPHAYLTPATSPAPIRAAFWDAPGAERCLPEAVDGWMGAAMQALRAGREAAGQLAAADLVRDLGGPFARTSILRRTVRHLFYTPVGRRGLEPRLAEGQAALAALMYAGARALEEAPEEADCRFQVLYGAARDLRIFWFSPLASWDPERLQGRRARTPAGHAWLAWARREAGTARRAAVHDDPDLRTREALSWRRALEPGQGPGSDFRWLESLENLGDLLEDERDREGLVRLWRVHGRQVRARPSLRGGKLALRFLRAVLAGESAPPAEVAAALAYLEGDDPAFSGRGLGGFSGAEVERLRGLARAGPPPGAPRPGAARPGAPPAPR